MTQIDSKLAIVVLAAGKGTRMRSDLPKVLHKIAGKAMVQHVLEAAAPLMPARQVVVIGPGMESVENAVRPAEIVVQAGQKGTGDAVLAASASLAEFAGDVLILYGDTPLVTPETVAALLARRRAKDDPAVVLLGMRPADSTGYGRIFCDASGQPAHIIETADATAEQLAIPLCNGGLMALSAQLALPLLKLLTPANSKGELYLTDLVALARAKGYATALVECDEAELRGVNDKLQLAEAEAALQTRLRRAALRAGVTLVDPQSVFLCTDTKFGKDVVVAPHVVFGPGVTLADRVTVHSFSHIEGAQVAADAIIGPFARLRAGSRVGQSAHIGNFVELKNTRLGTGAKANHLSYLGDADIGDGSNIGAGTITCNYDGFEKHRTEIGAGAFIGSNSSLVAPVKIGDGAMIGAGSTITKDVAADAMAVARGRQVELSGRAAGFRAARKKKKET